MVEIHLSDQQESALELICQKLELTREEALSRVLDEGLTELAWFAAARDGLVDRVNSGDSYDLEEVVEEIFPGDQEMISRVRGEEPQAAGQVEQGESAEPEQCLASLEDAILHISQNSKDLLDRLGDIK